MLIDIFMMRGEVPRLKDYLLPNEAATLARDCEFERGVIMPINENLHARSLPFPAKTLHRYDDAWLLWPDSVVSAIDSPLGQDQWQRVYFTGDGKPKVTAQDIAIDGSGFGPAAAYDLGVPRPEFPPAVISIDTSTGEEPPLGEPALIDDEDRVYIQTYVTRFGEEGAPGEPSGSVLIEKPGSTITLGLSQPTTNTHNITHTRVYRSVTAAGVGAYMLLAELPISNTEYKDSTRDLNSAVLETWDYDEPPENMQGLCTMANGICAGFAGNEVMFSAAYLPYAWPKSYRLTTEHTIQAIVPVGTSLVAVTRGYPYVFSGVTPDAMTATKLDIEQSCVSADSLVVVSGMAMYAAPDGLVVVSSDGAAIASEEIIDRKQWQALKPETIRAVAVEGWYVAQSETGGFIYDPLSKAFTRISDRWDATYVDLLTDTLFIVHGDKVSMWRQSEALKSMTWRSKVFWVPDDAALTSARVRSSEPGKLTVKVIADNQTILTVPQGELTNMPFRLPPVRASYWQIEVSGAAGVDRLMLSDSMQELA
ncbi:hypothetical protein [Salinivibrio proteolyticus]|uniref:Phage tail protein n=1 Tax=Salinivibrio proteolyticus TaxID=334715 RepID=A0ABY7LB51_9GAMM|nr:hypothetical protein [Salinivibrio proteolyticus]WBA13842.1 hypothetical protein N7E60_08870 [Salinivibrio proteolyticus]